MLDDEVDNTVKIAVLASEVNGLREQHKAHAETMFKKLDDHTKEAKEASAKLMDRIEPIAQWIQQNHEVPGRITVLWDERNNAKGFFKASSMIGGGIGALCVFIAERLFR